MMCRWTIAAATALRGLVSNDTTAAPRRVQAAFGLQGAHFLPAAFFFFFGAAAAGAAAFFFFAILRGGWLKELKGKLGCKQR